MLSYRLFAIECAKIALEAEGHPSKISLACLDAARKIELGIISDEELTYVKKRAEETAWCMAWGGAWEYANDSARYTLYPDSKMAAHLSSLFAAHSLVRTTNKSWKTIRKEQRDILKWN